MIPPADAPPPMIHSPDMAGLAAEWLGAGCAVRFVVRGPSMRPLIRDLDVLEIHPGPPSVLRPGDVVLARAGNGRLLAHRLARAATEPGRRGWILRGDARPTDDGFFSQECILGRADRQERAGRLVCQRPGLNSIAAWLWRIVRPAWHGVRRIRRLFTGGA